MRSLAILLALVLVALGGYWLWSGDGGADFEALEHEERSEELTPDIGELAAPETNSATEPQTVDEPIADVEETSTQRTAVEAEAWLTVQAVDRHTNQALSGQGIYVDFGEAREQTVEAFKRKQASTGSVGVGVLANKGGQASFRVPAGRELRAFVVLSDTTPPVGAPLEPEDGTSVSIPALAREESREVLIEVGTPQRTWHLKVVERGSGLPVSGATVASEADWKKLASVRASKPGTSFEFDVPPRHTTTDLEGRAAITIGERDNDTTSIHAEGYGPVYIPNATRREAETDPFIARLDRGATIRGQLLGVDEPESTWVHVSLSVSQLIQPPSEMHFSGGTETFTTRLGPTGDFELADLPPNVGLDMKFALPGDALEELQVEGLNLQPGEVYEHVWDLRSLGTVSGRVVDALGAPVHGVDVWLVSGVNPTSFSPHMIPLQASISAVDGRFEFGALTEGHYLVGIGEQEQADYSRRAAALAVPVEVRHGAPVEDVELVAYSGLYVRGKVVMPDGSPAGNVHVFIGRAGAPSLNEMTAGNGEFELGPLLAGEYRLQSYVLVHFEQVSAPPSILVEAPASGIEIRLLIGGSLEGRIVDAATGEHVPGRTSIQQPYGLHKISTATQGGHSAFDYDSLAVGTYNLTAWANDGRVGVLRGVQLEEGQRISGLEIPVSAAGALRVSYAGKRESVQLRVLLDDVDLESGHLSPGELLDCRAPVGTVVVEATSGDWTTPPAEREVYARRVVEVVEDEEVVVVLEE